MSCCGRAVSGLRLFIIVRIASQKTHKVTPDERNGASLRDLCDLSGPTFDCVYSPSGSLAAAKLGGTEVATYLYDGAASARNHF
jgi:hypothetical protein